MVEVANNLVKSALGGIAIPSEKGELSSRVERTSLSSTIDVEEKAEHHHPHLLVHIQAIVEPSEQTDPTFRSTRLYTPLTANEVRNRLIAQHRYSARDLPCRRSFSTKLNELGNHPKKVQ